MGGFVASCVAAILTVFDLDKTFYVPRRARQKAALHAWRALFVAGHGLLAYGVWLVVHEAEPFASWHWLVAGLAAGTGYLALVHVKFTSFQWNNAEVPFGFELLYQGAKDFIYKRINSITLEARGRETQDYADKYALDQLARTARLKITQNRLLSDVEKEDHKRFILGVLTDAASDELEKKWYIANYILSGDH